MKKHLTAVCLVIAVIGLTASVLMEDFLFAISFLWVFVDGIHKSIDSEQG